MPAATNAPRATAERALIMTVPCHGPLRPFTDGQLVSSAGFRMSSPVRKTVSSRRSFVSSPPGGRNIVGSRRRRGDPAGGSGTSAIKIPVGAGNLPACPRCPPCRRSWCFSPSGMKAWMFSGLGAHGRRPGRGLCGNRVRVPPRSPTKSGTSLILTLPRRRLVWALCWQIDCGCNAQEPVKRNARL
jgi:hypothetical protein